MQERNFEELERRAAKVADVDEIRQMEARSRVSAEIRKMRENGEAFTLTAEEEELLLAFRAFKKRSKNRLFMWTAHKQNHKGVHV